MTTMITKEPKQKLTERERRIKQAECSDVMAWAYELQAELYLDEGEDALHGQYVGFAKSARESAERWRQLAERYKD